MRALSILQPWSWLIIHGHKTVENRTWRHSHRGRFAVHAGKGFDLDGHRFVRQHFPSIALPAIDAFERGGIVGLAKVVDCVSEHDSPWFFGPHAFVLAEARPIPFIPLRGERGFFPMPPAALDAICKEFH